MAKTKKKNEEVEQNTVSYTKEQVLRSRKYKDRRDVLGAILTDGKMYTHQDAESLLEKFMKGKVN